jgi:hypothetical protein
VDAVFTRHGRGKKNAPSVFFTSFAAATGCPWIFGSNGKILPFLEQPREVQMNATTSATLNKLHNDNGAVGVVLCKLCLAARHEAGELSEATPTAYLSLPANSPEVLVRAAMRYDSFCAMNQPNGPLYAANIRVEEMLVHLANSHACKLTGVRPTSANNDDPPAPAATPARPGVFSNFSVATAGVSQASLRASAFEDTVYHYIGNNIPLVSLRDQLTKRVIVGAEKYHFNPDNIDLAAHDLANKIREEDVMCLTGKSGLVTMMLDEWDSPQGYTIIVCSIMNFHGDVIILDVRSVPKKKLLAADIHKLLIEYFTMIDVLNTTFGSQIRVICICTDNATTCKSARQSFTLTLHSGMPVFEIACMAHQMNRAICDIITIFAPTEKFIRNAMIDFRRYEKPFLKACGFQMRLRGSTRWASALFMITDFILIMNRAVEINEHPESSSPVERSGRGFFNRVTKYANMNNWSRIYLAGAASMSRVLPKLVQSIAILQKDNASIVDAVHVSEWIPNEINAAINLTNHEAREATDEATRTELSAQAAKLVEFHRVLVERFADPDIGPKLKLARILNPLDESVTLNPSLLPHADEVDVDACCLKAACPALVNDPTLYSDCRTALVAYANLCRRPDFSQTRSRLASIPPPEGEHAGNRVVLLWQSEIVPLLVSNGTEATRAVMKRKVLRFVKTIIAPLFRMVITSAYVERAFSRLGSIWSRFCQNRLLATAIRDLRIQMRYAKNNPRKVRRQQREQHRIHNAPAPAPAALAVIRVFQRHADSPANLDAAEFRVRGAAESDAAAPPPFALVAGREELVRVKRQTKPPRRFSPGDTGFQQRPAAQGLDSDSDEDMESDLEHDDDARLDDMDANYAELSEDEDEEEVVSVVNAEPVIDIE